MAARPLITQALLLLNVDGVDPYTSNGFSKVRFAFSVTIMVVALVECLGALALKWRGLDSMESIVICTAVCQVLTKMVILVTKRDSFVEVMNKMNQFWPIDRYGTEVQNDIENIYSSASKIVKFMLIFLIFIMIIFIAEPIFATPRKLIFVLYHPNDLNSSPGYELAFAYEILIATVSPSVLIGFDFLFVSIILNIACELKLLKKAIGCIEVEPNVRGDSKTTLKKIYKIIEHHNLILDCIKNVREIYSFWLLNIYFYNMIEMCGGLLSMIATGFPPTYESFSKYGFFVIFYMLQLYLYCAVGQYLITESESVSATAYGIDWWTKTQPELRRALIMIIQRANKEENLTAGGMFELNLQSFRKVTRSALSFFTLVNAVYEDT